MFQAANAEDTAGRTKLALAARIVRDGEGEISAKTGPAGFSAKLRLKGA